MSGLDDFLKGLAVFKEGMSQYAQSRAINDANEAVQKLHATEKDKAAIFEQQSQIGKDLGMRLHAAGADSASTAQLVSQFSPSAGAVFQADQNKDLQESSQKFQSQENDKKIASAEKIAGMQAIRASNKMTDARRKELGQFATKYQKEFNALSRKNMEALNSAVSAGEVLKSGNPIGDQAVKMMLAKAIQGGSQLSDAEREVFGGAKGLQDKAKAIKEEMSTGKLSPANRVYMIQLVAKLEKAAERNISKARTHVAGQAWQTASKTGHDFSREEISELIYEMPSSIKPASSNGASSGLSPVSPNTAPNAHSYLKD